MDAQGPVDQYCGIPPQRSEPAGHRPGRSVLLRSRKDGRQALGHLEPAGAAGTVTAGHCPPVCGGSANAARAALQSDMCRNRGRRRCNLKQSPKPRGRLMRQAELKGLAERYAAFAIDEARGSSEAYEKLALAIAQSGDLLQFIATFPVEKRQPNLFLAAVRHVCGVPRGVDELRQFVRASEAQIREVMLSRTTQTHETARCAVLLPLLAQLAQPLALIEVGASALMLADRSLWLRLRLRCAN